MIPFMRFLFTARKSQSLYSRQLFINDELRQFKIRFTRLFIWFKKHKKSIEIFT